MLRRPVGHAELALFKITAVVSERLRGDFAEVFYELWHDDLPVFISCDAFSKRGITDAMLEEVEGSSSAQSKNARWDCGLECRAN